MVVTQSLMTLDGMASALLDLSSRTPTASVTGSARALIYGRVRADHRHSGRRRAGSGQGPRSSAATVGLVEVLKVDSGLAVHVSSSSGFSRITNRQSWAIAGF